MSTPTRSIQQEQENSCQMVMFQICVSKHSSDSDSAVSSTISVPIKQTRTYTEKSSNSTSGIISVLLIVFIFLFAMVGVTNAKWKDEWLRWLILISVATILAFGVLLLNFLCLQKKDVETVTTEFVQYNER